MLWEGIDKDRDGSENVALLTIEPPDKAGNPRIFYWKNKALVNVVLNAMTSCVFAYNNSCRNATDLQAQQPLCLSNSKKPEIAQ
jgi:hypothetical protein